MAALMAMLSAKMDAKFEAVYARLDAIDNALMTCATSGAPNSVASKKFWTLA